MRAIDQARNSIMHPLKAASMESYQRAYPFVVQLHILNELEKSWDVLTRFVIDQKPELTFTRPMNAPLIHKMVAQWEQRIRVTQPSFKIREPILNLRLHICALGDTDEVCSFQLSISLF